MSSLDRMTAIVTGASSGIGAAAAHALAGAGCKVVLAARRRERLDELAGAIENSGGSAHVVACDLLDPQQATELAAEALGAYGQIDILVNNAGQMLLGPLAGGNVDEWNRMVDLNLKALLWVSEPVMRHMQERGSGHIVNVSSVAGRVAGPRFAVYNATKFGVTGLSDAMRQELGPSGIRVTCVEPGAVRTELTDHISHDETKEMIDEFLGSIEALEPEDIAASILYAVSQPQRVNVNQLTIRPTQQTGAM